MKKEKIQNTALVVAIEQANSGLVDADLGGHVIKQRIARKGQGKSGGYRTIVAFKKGDKAFFIYGFAKKDKGNIEKQELQAFKEYAKILFRMSAVDLEHAIKHKKLVEVT